MDRTESGAAPTISAGSGEAAQVYSFIQVDREKIDAALTERTKNWIKVQCFLAILFPLAWIQILLFWINFAGHEHLNGKKAGIVKNFFTGMYLWVLLLLSYYYFESDFQSMEETWGITRIDLLFWFAVFVLLAIAFYLIESAIDRKKLDLLEWYMELGRDGVFNVRYYAEATGRDPNKVTTALQFLNAYGFFPYIVDEATGNLYEDETYRWDEAEEEQDGESEYEEEYEDEEDYEDEGEYEEDAEPELVVAECPGCGSKTKLYSDEVVDCQYCGSPVKAS
ncbi:hypothetical protein [Cohnella caldifontis]|uniref:hypothetical protein n=1 Tax=Cohnella caldifontis TaxID=3027471 RepID=UPI0023EC0327|nr:hypothetical protein [Cohnella sp. YIM B05605]